MEPQRKSIARPAQRLVGVWIALGLLLLAALLAVWWQQSSKTETAETLPAEISVAQAAEKRNHGAFILDVREQQEWDTVHIPDATLIPLAQLSSRLSEVPKDQEVVIVCRSGNRSAQARDLLKEAGYSNVASMAGGMNEWQDHGFPTVNGP